ncbi:MULTISPECIES: benzaldehyde dehydrogenase [unclassified Microbacterium]|uniref:benzaldehyde dehydrogenase n=1 Tax=unclassified Microbacterium TaxID=2609290 RepID=UPI00214B0DA6|nr:MULTISPECIES: benzaldehyde dehydrogenase [unclassified Microbacterium]MCR2811004.1 benzaldehyde dehydrogenase [Microbacterium sp. zg.B185]WIM19598.1 benzaldehyde dehydrogenase [Microbacterium sp. zg-B185]
MTIDTTTPLWHHTLFSDGWRAGAAEPITVTAPGTGTPLATIAQADPTDLDRAVESATAAQKRWSKLSYAVRAAVMLKAAQLLESDPARLADVLVPESGSGHGKAAFEVGLVVSELQEAAALASHPYGELLRSVKERTSIARRVPLGVVGVISPFNFPAILSMRSVAPALALGNAVILKPDPRTSISGGLALAALFEEAGLPGGVLHVLPGGGELGAALVTHPGVPCISFTGSTQAGRKVGAAAAPLLKRVHLELGGNNAMLVLPDADVQAAASVGAWGSFLHQGQICMTTGRHLVHRSIAAEYIAALSEKAKGIPVGDPAEGLPLGPIIDEGQRDRVHGYVLNAVENGATLAAGGEYDGLYYRPTVLTDVAVENPAWTEEIFGPVAPVQVYDDIDEAIEIINATEYGLSVSIITSNPYAAYELCDRIESGAVHINDATVDDEAVIPFGGTKASGVGGRFGGPQANLDTFTETQWITMQSRVERYPF